MTQFEIDKIKNEKIFKKIVGFFYRAGWTQRGSEEPFDFKEAWDDFIRWGWDLIKKEMGQEE